jgi:hypothetical protein
MKLTPVQREVLLALFDLYHRSRGEAIKGEDIARLINRNPGTIRNQMQALRSLGLVEGVPGPKGGYRPTREGYTSLNMTKFEKEAPVPIWINDTALESLSVTEVDLISIPDPNSCKAYVRCVGDLKNLQVGQKVRIGPMPITKLIMEGTVIGRDDIDNVLLIEIMEMISIPKEKIIDIATKNVTSISPKQSVRDAAKILLKEKIRGVPVLYNGTPVGIISTTDVARALAMGMEDSSVRELMTSNVLTIHQDAYLWQAIEKMENYNISRLIVVDSDGKVKGIVTRTDILCRIGKLCQAISSFS